MALISVYMPGGAPGGYIYQEIKKIEFCFQLQLFAEAGLFQAWYRQGMGANGITGYKKSWDGSGIDFKEEDNGNEWRWTAQWIPHSAWFLQAVIAMTAE